MSDGYLRIINRLQLLLPEKGGTFAVPTAQPWIKSMEELPETCLVLDRVQRGQVRSW